MEFSSIPRLLARSALVATMTLALFAGTVAAHRQTVTPHGNGEGFQLRPISNAWAQAHCNARSPSIVGERSKGVVQFIPAEAMACPPVPNPGGQIHGD